MRAIRPAAIETIRSSSVIESPSAFQSYTIDQTAGEHFPEPAGCPNGLTNAKGVPGDLAPDAVEGTEARALDGPGRLHGNGTRSNLMAEWDVNAKPDGDVHVLHLHDDNDWVHADVATDASGSRQAECIQCHAVLPIDRGIEERAKAVR